MKYQGTEQEITIGDIVKSVMDHDFYEVLEIRGEQLQVKKVVSSKEETEMDYAGLYKPVSAEFKKVSDLKKKLLLKDEEVSFGDTFSDRYLDVFFFSHMNFCGCGDPQGNLSLLGEMLEHVHNDRHLDYNEKVVKKNAILGDKYHVHEFMLQSMDSWGLLEHGGSVWGSWLSEEGEELLRHLKIWEDFKKE